MVQINWTLQSKEDLKKIADYIAKDSEKYAKLQVFRIINKTQILKEHMYIGRIVQEINNNVIRELIEGRYRIIYKIVSKSQIDILTIYHTSRDLRKLKIT